MSTYIVADELHFMGYRVAILTTDAPATVIGEFEDQINNGILFEHEHECSECKQSKVIPHLHDCSKYIADLKAQGALPSYDTALDEVIQEITKASRGGLVRLRDVRAIVHKLEGRS